MGEHSTLFFALVIFGGAAVFGTLAMYTRQSLLVAYMLLGLVLGPWCLKIIPNTQIVSEIGDIGIIFLLFLLGLDLQPRNFMRQFSKTIWLTIVSSIVLGIIGYVIGRLFYYSFFDSFIIGLTMMFSSTVIGLKLLPTTILHHRHTGEIMIAILLLQDALAILLLLVLQAMYGTGAFSWKNLILVGVGFPILLLTAYLGARFIIIKLFERFDIIHEYLWIVAVGWCLFLAVLAQYFNLTAEIGAFVAGVTLASYPIAQYIAESFKQVRDLFLVAFFFSIGAHFNPSFLPEVIFPALILAATILLVKPLVFQGLLRRDGESQKVGWEVGVRLGQNSEFSLLLAYLASNMALIGAKTSFLIQAVTILSFVVSSYWVVLRYATPLAISEKLRQD